MTHRVKVCVRRAVGRGGGRTTATTFFKDHTKCNTLHLLRAFFEISEIMGNYVMLQNTVIGLCRNFTNTEFHYRNLKTPRRHEVCNLYDAKHV